MALGRLGWRTLLLRWLVIGLCGLLPLRPVWGQGSASVASPPAAAGAAAGKPTSANTPEEYRLGPGDQIRITVYQNPDLSMETRINEAGTISYPLLGSVRLGGLSVTAAETRLASELRDGGFLRNPQVMILVAMVRANQINVLGMVAKPGRYPLDVGGMRFTDVLAMVGGALGESGSDTAVVMGQRNGQPTRLEIDVPGIFAPGGQAGDVLILPGDTIWVDRAPQVYLQGEINRPGPMRLGRNMTLMHVLASAGGISQRGTLRGLRIVRRNPQGRYETFTPASMEDSLRDGDVIIVPESLL